MNTHPTHTTWSAYLDGALDASQQATIEGHLTDCLACRTDLNARRAFRRRLERLALPLSPQASTLLTERAWTAVRPRLGRQRFAIVRPFGRAVYGLGTVALALLFVWGLVALFTQLAGSTAPETSTLKTQLTETFTLTVNLNASYAYEMENDFKEQNLLPVRYTVELHNSGPDIAANVQITDVLPSLLTCWEDNLSADAAYHLETHTITWAGALEAGETRAVDFVCGVPWSVSGSGNIAANQVIVDDGLHAPFTQTLAVNFTPWPTVVPTAGPRPTRTPWYTPTPLPPPVQDSPISTPTQWFPPTATATPTAGPGSAVPPTRTPRSTPILSPTLTPWFRPTPPPPPTPTPLPSPTRTPWFMPTPLPPPTDTLAPPPGPTPTPFPLPTDSAPPTPTKTPRRLPGDTPPPTPTLADTPTPWFTPTPAYPPGNTPTPRPTP